MNANTLEAKKIKVGDLVNWRGSFGSAVQRHARVTSIELCPSGGKYGVDVPEIEAGFTKLEKAALLIAAGFCGGQDPERQMNLKAIATTSVHLAEAVIEEAKK